MKIGLTIILLLFSLVLNAQRVSSTHFFYFNSSSTDLSKQEEKKIIALCDTLKQHKVVSVSVTGHTDDSGDENDNLILSEKRANSVKQLLIDNGILVSMISISSMGESNPIEPNTTEKKKARNRRVEVRVVYE